MNKMRFRLAAYTDPAGKWNENAPKKGNEDDLFVDADLSNDVQGQFIADEVIDLSDAGCLMAVADGMGGMNAGEVASAIAIQTVKSAFSKESLTDEILSSTRSRTKYLEKVVVDADAAIKKKSREDKACEGMGSTLILAWLYDEELTVTWCGDSRAYIFRKTEGIRQISKDHSYVQGLVDSGSITEVEAFDHPYGNIITRSLGDPEKKAQADSITVSVYKEDVIMLCSDGLSGVLRDRKSFDSDGELIPGDNLEDIIRANCSSMAACREALWTAAEKAEWYDNVTAVLCEIVDGNENQNSRIIEEGGTSNEVVNKSVINIRLHKKHIKIVGIVFGILSFCLLAYFVGVKYIHRYFPKEIVVKVDSLHREAEALGVIYISELLNETDRDKIDLHTFEGIRKEFDKRVLALSELDSLANRADSLGLSGSLSVISVLQVSMKIAVSPDCDIQRLKSSVDLAAFLQIQITDFLERNKKILSTKQRKQIEDFKTMITEKEYIDRSDKDKWNRLSKQIIGQKVQEIITEPVSPNEDHPEKSIPSLTPVAE